MMDNVQVEIADNDVSYINKNIIFQKYDVLR